MQLKQLEATIIEALENVKATDIEVIDTGEMTPMFDRVIVASAESNRQTRALARNVQEQVKAAGGEIVGTEGEDSGEWVLVDAGDVVVHIMQPAIRAHYQLEDLWAATPAARRKVDGKPTDSQD